MGLTKETASGRNFIERETSQSEALKAVTAIQSFDTQLGSAGASGNTVFTLPFSYIPDTNTLLVFINGQKAEVKVTATGSTQYEETNSQTVTFGAALLSTDLVEFIVAGAYIIEDLSALGIIPQGESILFKSDINVLGYTIDPSVNDQVVYISSGGAGGTKGGSTWTRPVGPHRHQWHKYVGGSDPSETWNSAGALVNFNVGGTTGGIVRGLIARVTSGDGHAPIAQFYTDDGNAGSDASWRPLGQNYTVQTKN